MTKLNSIILSNIRRFSDNVEIKIEDGATIFLAPNGTGKTAIFEAIELALTKRIRRFSDENNNYDFSPVIRDVCDKASIELKFGDSRAYSVYLEPNNKPSFNGDLSAFSENTPEDDLPYLFHMTHLLNQSQKDWFVQIGEKDAGEQLDHLSIGKDATIANKTIMGAKRASKQLLDTTKKEYLEAESECEKWIHLINERNELLKNSGSPLLSLEEIFDKIKGVAGSEITTDEAFSPNINLIKTTLARASSVIEQRVEDTTGKITKFASMRSIPNSYDNAQKRLIGHKELLVTTRSKKLAINSQLDLHNEKTTIEENNKNTSLSRLSELEIINKKLKSRNQLKVKTDQFTTALNEVSKRYDTNKGHLVKLENKLKQSEELQDKYNKIRLQENSITKDREILVKMHQALNDWKKNLLDIEKYKEIQTSINAMVTDLKNKLNTTEEKKDASEVIYKQEIFNFESINEASNQIHEAVVSIAKSLPKEQDDCPVCGVSHGYLQLQEKITKALDAMNPALVPAKINMENAENELNQLKSKVKKIDLELGEKNIELDKVSAQINELLADISSIKQNLFPSCHNPNEAKQVLEAKNVNIIARSEEIEKSKSSLLQEPTELELNTLRLEIQSFQNKKNSDQGIIKETESGLLSTNIDLKSIDSYLMEHKTLLQSQNIDLRINKKKEEVEKINLTLDKLYRIRLELEKDIADTNKAVTICEQDVSTTTQTIDELIQNWKVVSLEGTPSAMELTNAISKSENLLSQFNEKKQALNKISPELAQWAAMDTLNDCNDKINSIRKESSESEYTELLKKEIKNRKKQHADIEQRHNTLNKFSLYLKKALNDTQKHIQRFAPLRNKLLKKIVVEPRYSEVDTDTSQFRGKQQAKTTTNIHNKNVFVSKTASEAQLTDLQLTFLLSMAKTHNWSSWKALLLDDPTQHHDLVHAAGVYDVLRDYIVDDGFQILLSTHDSIQANFFKRKLENDGIPVKIWELAATENGVIAELRN